MNVLVVGGAGYIGSHCVRQLSAAGHRPVVLDNLVYGHRGAVAPGVPLHRPIWATKPPSGASWAREDRRRDALRGVLLRRRVRHRPPQVLPEQLGGHAPPARAMLAVGVRKFVFSSTCATFGVPARSPSPRRAAGADQPLRPDQARRGERAQGARPRREDLVRRVPVFQRGGRRRGRLDRRGPRSRRPT
jgi:nucleoside-diphosphate-sugar epimerase